MPQLAYKLKYLSPAYNEHNEQLLPLPLRLISRFAQEEGGDYLHAPIPPTPSRHKALLLILSP